MTEHLDPRSEPGTEASPPANRAERRARRRSRGPIPRTTVKVQRVRFDHATDPRQYAAHRRG